MCFFYETQRRFIALLLPFVALKESQDKLSFHNLDIYILSLQSQELIRRARVTSLKVATIQALMGKGRWVRRKNLVCRCFSSVVCPVGGRLTTHKQD